MLGTAGVSQPYITDFSAGFEILKAGAEDNIMRCEDFREELALYADDALEIEARDAIESHLPSCPLCRQALDDYRGIRLGLQRLGNPEMPFALRDKLMASIPGRVHEREMFVQIGPVRDRRDFLAHWLMPLGAGALGTAVFLILFVSLLLVRPGFTGFENQRSSASKIEINAMPPGASALVSDDDLLRVEIPETSPEVNPASALVALTRSIVRGDMRDDEVVVVADVFGNGLARISEIVEPPKDAQAMKELKRAFETEPDQAPFLPARVSAGSDAVRVVLRIQRVDVRE